MYSLNDLLPKYKFIFVLPLCEQCLICKSGGPEHSPVLVVQLGWTLTAVHIHQIRNQTSVSGVFCQSISSD